MSKCKFIELYRGYVSYGFPTKVNYTLKPNEKLSGLFIANTGIEVALSFNHRTHIYLAGELGANSLDIAPDQRITPINEDVKGTIHGVIEQNIATETIISVYLIIEEK